MKNKAKIIQMEEAQKRLARMIKKRGEKMNNSRRIPDGQYCLDCQRIGGRIHARDCQKKDNTGLAKY